MNRYIFRAVCFFRSSFAVPAITPQPQPNRATRRAKIVRYFGAQSYTHAAPVSRPVAYVAPSGCDCAPVRECEECGVFKPVAKFSKEVENTCLFCVNVCVECDCHFTHTEHEGTRLSAYCAPCAEDHATCDDCGDVMPQDDAFWHSEKDCLLCQDCYDEACFSCDDCGSTHERGTEHNYSTVPVEMCDKELCGHCCENYYSCDDCGAEMHAEDATHTDNGTYCSGCAPRGCSCHIRNRVNVRGVRQDERFQIVVKGGEVTDAGFDAINEALKQFGFRVYRSTVGTEYRTDKGNFAKRVAKYFKDTHGIRLSDHTHTYSKRVAVTDATGTIKRQESGAPVYTFKDVTVPLVEFIGTCAAQNLTQDSAPLECEFTRRFDLGADAFVHSSSCWFASYSESMCHFKESGGIGFRTFDTYGTPVTRAWILPVTIAEDGACELCEEETANGFLVFNGYAARHTRDATKETAHALAQFFTMPYKQVTWNPSEMYLNDNPYLIAESRLLKAANESPELALSLPHTYGCN